MLNAQQPFASDLQIPEATYDRPSGQRSQSRSVVLASHGIVATSHPLAAEVGLDILKRGGNAFDAAIATNAMLGLVEPMSCGIGGDLFAICWDAKTRKMSGLNASGRSPFSLSRKVFADQGLDQIPTYGPLSWSVPGCVDGWAELADRFGSQPLAELLAPSIEYADGGFPVSEVIAGYWNSAESRLAEWEDSAMTYLPNGRALRQGEMFRNPHLAASYREIAEHGRDAFYRGSIADEIVAFSQRNGGYFSKQDFEEHSSEWLDPVSTDYRGHTVWELPPNGQGIAVLQMLNILEQFDVASLGHNSADLLHLIVEAKKLAFADRATFYADPAFGELPIAELISKEYAQRQRKRISFDRAATDVPPGDPKLSRGDTVYLTVVDKDRNCCSLIQSIYYGFGSQVVPGNTGFAMQNRGNLFALDDTHLNRLEPHKRPFHTIIPGW
jgi:gamma-glutamyltranspeptidase/glutathione hydrolase